MSKEVAIKQNSPCSAIASVLSTNQGAKQKHTCICCRIKLESVALQRAHFKTEWHLYNLKRRICNLDPIDSDDFDQIQANPPKEPERDDDAYSLSNSILRDMTAEETPQYALSEASDDDCDWELVGADDLLNEIYTDEEAAELLERIVDADTCLFCDKKSSNIKTNVHHMNLFHGFFIPEERYLIDLPGLMDYLGFKVGAGATCLWCNKQFSTVHGARLHMIYKDHCKIVYDQERAVEEFKDFYDYSAQKQVDMKPLDQLVLPKRRFEKISEYKRTLAKKDNDKQMRLNGILKPFVDKGFIPGPHKGNAIKRFDSKRAKILLKTGVAGNQTLRARMRMQNPI